MNHIVRLFLLLALIVGILAVSVTATFADQDDPQPGESWVVDTGELSLILFDRPEGSRITALAAGTRLQVLSLTKVNRWVWVFVTLPDNSSGWVVATTGDGDSWLISRSSGADASDGVPEAEVSAMIAEADGDVAELLSLLDEAFNDRWFRIGGAWTRDDVENGGEAMVGPRVFWTDLLDSVTSLPAGVSRVATQGNWGAYEVAPGVTFVVQSPNGGGRWIPLDSGNYMPNNYGSNCEVLSDLRTSVRGMAPEEIINYLDEVFEHDTSPYFGAGDSLEISRGMVGVVWTDFGNGGIPTDAEPLIEGSTSGGWGVWQIEGPKTFNPRNGGGMVILNCIGQNG